MKEIFYISLLASPIFAYIFYLHAKVDVLNHQNKALHGLNLAQEELIKGLKNYNDNLIKDSLIKKISI